MTWTAPTERWALNESSAGSSPVTRVGSLGNNLTDINTCPSITGPPGGESLAVSMTDTSNEYLLGGNIIAPTGSFSLAVQGYMPSAGISTEVMFEYPSRYLLQREAPGRFYFYLYKSGGGFIAVPFVAETLDAWFRLLISWNGTTARINVEGTAGTGAGTGPINNPTNTFRLGNSGGGSSWRFSSLMWWSGYALTTDEETALMATWDWSGAASSNGAARNYYLQMV